MNKLPHVDVYHQSPSLGGYSYFKEWFKNDEGKPTSIQGPSIRKHDWNADELRAIADHMLLREKVENRFVVGFCFNEERDRVALIKKKRPSWQAGLWNGLGGSIENETPVEAMRREFLEESGVDVASWLHALTIVMENKHLYVFRAFDDRVEECSTQTDEEVAVWYRQSVVNTDFTDGLPNVRWFLPMLVLDHYRFPIVIRDVVNPERISQDTADPIPTVEELRQRMKDSGMIQ